MPGFLDQLNADLAGLDENKPKSGNFTRGLKQSWEETKGTGYGIVGLGGALASKANIPYANEVKDWGLENAQAKFDASEKLGQETDQLEGINSVGDAGKYLSHGLGYVAGQAVPSLVTGGAGSIIGKQLVKQGIKRAVTKEAADLIAKKGMERGAIAGAGVASYGQEAGSIYPDMVKDGHDEPGRAALFAVPAAALDVIPEMRIAKGLTGGITRDAETSLFKYAAKEVPRQAAMEGVTEGLQSVVERAAGYKSLGDKEALSDYANSAALGVLGGGAAGALAAPFHRVPVSPKALDNKMNETSVLNPPTQAEIDAEFKARQPALFEDLAPPTPPVPPPNVPSGTQLGLFGENTPPPGPALAVPTPVVTPPDPRKEMIGQVRGAFEQALTSVGTTPNKGQVTRAVGQITSGVNTAEEVADRLDAQVKELAASGKKENVARAETLAIWRDNLRGVPEAERQGVVGQTAAAAPVQAAPEQTAPVEGQTPNEATAEDLFAQVAKQAGERNAQIWRDLSTGMTKTEAAKKYGITPDRVKEIRRNFEAKAAKVAQERGLTKEKVLGQRVQGEEEQTVTEAEAQNEGLTVPHDTRTDTGLSDVNSNVARSMAQVAERGPEKVEEGTLHSALEGHLAAAAKEGQAPGEAAKHKIVINRILAEVMRREKIRKTKGAEAAHVEENDDASEVREDQGQPGQERKEPEGRKDRGGQNLQQPAQAKPETGNAEKPVAPKRVLKKKAPEAAAATPSKSADQVQAEGEVVPKTATPETNVKSTLEQAGEAWDKHKAADQPAWNQLTKAQQKTFADYGPENWTKEDVANEAKKLTPAATPESVPPMYYTRTPVEARVYDEETNQYDMEQMPAKEALDHIEHDIGTMNLLLNCLRGA